MSDEVTTTDVADKFIDFLETYDEWRRNHGLSGDIDNVFEIFTGMVDKNARAGRQIKHRERNDPKDDWPVGMVESLAGYMVYMTMIMRRYQNEEIGAMDIYEAFENELNKSIKQHKKS